MYVLKELQPTLFGDNKVYLNDYLLLISPVKGIHEDVKKFKRELGQRIGSYDAINSLPHISLLRFSCIVEQEIKLFDQLASYCRQQRKILIRLNQFNHFDHSRTLFIDVANKPDLLELQQKLLLHLKLEMKGIDWAKRDFDPHLTVAKKLSSSQFPVALQRFSHRPYKKNFFCTRLTLLKRSYDHRNEREFWMKVREIPLGENHEYKIVFTVAPGYALSDFLPELKN